MLKLDEKKIRKGRPIGLPYIGSKKKVSKKIVEIIKQNFGSDKPVYDIFGGGGAVTAELLLNGFEVHYNDLDSDITDMFVRVISQDREWIKTLIVSRDEFFDILSKSQKTVDDKLKLLINSFANNQKNYLYGKKQSDMKYNLAVKIIKKHDVFGGYRQTETYKNAQQEQLERLQQLQRLEQLERLERLQQLQQLEVTNRDYTAFSNVENAILYLDPPYENTKNPYKFKFDHQLFYDWCVKMARKNVVIISSYDISDPHFEVSFRFENAHGTFIGGQNTKKHERLFMVKK